MEICIAAHCSSAEGLFNAVGTAVVGPLDGEIYAPDAYKASARAGPPHDQASDGRAAA